MFCYFMSILVLGKRERELDALLSLSSWCHMQFVIVIFPNHTQLLFWVSFMRTAMALASLHICLV